MTAFQQSVKSALAFGIVGELFLDGPVRSSPWTLQSGAQVNRIGRAFTVVSEGVAMVGGAGAFAGILANPKNYALTGASGNPLAASLDLPNNAIGELVTMGQIIVDLGAAANIDDLVDYDTTTGALSPRLPVQPSSGAQRVAFASNVATVTLTPAGAPAIGIGSIITAADGQSVRVVKLGTGTGGNGTYTVSGAADASAQAFSYTSVPASGKANVPNARVINYSVGSNGLAVIALTN